MKVKLNDIRDDGLSVELAATTEECAKLLNSTELTLHPPLGGVAEITKTSDGVLILGTLRARVSLQCSRCLVSFDLDIDGSFTLFSPLGAAKRVEGAKDGEDYFEIREESFDLSPLVAEQIALELPIKPLCKDDCKGLCLKCGIDLNKDRCDCHSEPKIDPRLAKLKDFKVKTK